MYTLSQFEENYIKVHFDDLLLERNNKMVNSNEHYLKWKMTYLNETKNNYNRLKTLLTTLETKYSLNISNNTTRKTFKFINENTLESTNNEIKQILVDQKKMYTHFINHIQFLNKIKDAS